MHLFLGFGSFQNVGQLNLSKWGTNGYKKRLPNNPVKLFLLFILNIPLNGPKNVPIFIGINKNFFKSYKSADMSTWGGFRSHIHGRKSLKTLKSSFAIHPRKVAVCGAGRHCRGSLFIDSLEHRDTNREVTERHVVWSSLKNQCSLTVGL